MIKEIEIKLLPHEVDDYSVLRRKAVKQLHIQSDELKHLQIIKRSIDARSKNPFYRLKCNAFVNENYIEKKIFFDYKNVENKKHAVIIGFGPAGMFAALRLLELGIKPIIFERGKDVQNRRRDIRALTQEHIVNPDSNYCFGEGGAGTFSDGKLYTRSTKRGNVRRILESLVYHGASNDILIDAHPHIGSNKLPKIIRAIRETILNYGGEIYFQKKLTDIIIQNNSVKGVVVNNNEELDTDVLILATGHSARDIFSLLHKRGVLIESKPFALGVRIEHPQRLIDEIQYHSKIRNSHLPAASYSLTCQVKERGVFSFCMCPGGIVVPSSTSPGELVVNGMSVSRRDSPFANSGFVVTVSESDLIPYKDVMPFQGVAFQKAIEKISFIAGGCSQTAPAQRVTDFINKKFSNTLPKSSYIPGINSVSLHELLPSKIVESLKTAFIQSDKKMKGYITEEAVITSPESRTSSPIKIPRDDETLMHIHIQGLFPAGEGAGYAGGIVSAAMDGEKIAEAVQRFFNNNFI